MNDPEWLRGSQQRPYHGDDEIPIVNRPLHLWSILGLVLLVWGVGTSYFTVEANEEAVILRLGDPRCRWSRFHFKAPFGIDHVHKGAVKTIHQAWVSNRQRGPLWYPQPTWPRPPC